MIFFWTLWIYCFMIYGLVIHWHTRNVILFDVCRFVGLMCIYSFEWSKYEFITLTVKMCVSQARYEYFSFCIRNKVHDKPYHLRFLARSWPRQWILYKPRRKHYFYSLDYWQHPKRHWTIYKRSADNSFKNYISQAKRSPREVDIRKNLVTSSPFNFLFFLFSNLLF